MMICHQVWSRIEGKQEPHQGENETYESWNQYGVTLSPNRFLAVIKLVPRWPESVIEPLQSYHQQQHQQLLNCHLPSPRITSLKFQQQNLIRQWPAMIGLGSDEDPYYGGILWHFMIKLPFPSLLVATLWVTFLADLELCITHNESQIEGSFFHVWTMYSNPPRSQVLLFPILLSISSGFWFNSIGTIAL